MKGPGSPIKRAGAEKAKTALFVVVRALSIYWLVFKTSFGIKGMDLYGFWNSV